MVQYNDIAELPKRFQKFLSIKLEINESLVLAWQPNGKEYQPDQLIPQLMGLFFCFLAYILFWGTALHHPRLKDCQQKILTGLWFSFVFGFFLGGIFYLDAFLGMVMGKKNLIYFYK